MGVIAQASFLIPNETELAILTDMAVESEAEVSAAALSLVAQGVETVIVTLGARGALVATAQGARAIAPVRVQAVDTTGAGDAFIGAFARYVAGGLSLDEALAEATRYSALSVTRHGAQKSYPTEAEFAALSAKSG
jgi:ribokinase